MKNYHVNRVSSTYQHNQVGVALIVSLIIMLLMTIIGLSVFRGNNLYEKIAGATRERQRALQAADTALRYGENWILANSTNSSALNAVGCTGTSLTTLKVCNNGAATLAGLSTLPFYSYTGTGLTVGSGGLVSSSATSDIKYSAYPQVYIYLESFTFNGQKVYQVTAIGYGGTQGNSAAKAVVSSLYSLPSNSGCGSGGKSCQ